MANLPENTNYSGASMTPVLSNSPNKIYSNLAEMKRQGGSPFAPQTLAETGTPDYYQGIKEALVNVRGQQANLPTATQFMPPVENPRVPSAIPSDYSGFAPAGSVPGTSYQWINPAQPKIYNVSGDTPSQYVRDVANPGALVKSVRGGNSIMDQAMLNGRSSLLYQVDHTMPLALGGADTMGNREVLTNEQHDIKTKAQAVPYTLYVNGVIPLQQAQLLATQWKERDLTNIPEPDSYGLIPIDLAKQAAANWQKVKEPTFKEKMAAIPEGFKDFGKGWLPNSVREFVKGFGSGASFGFLPYQQGENENMVDKVSGWAGMLAGGVASFFTGEALLAGALRIGGIAAGSLNLLRGRALATAAKVGLGTANVAGDVKNVATAAETAKNINTTASTFKTLNTPPTYLQRLLTPETMKNAARIGAVNATVGEINRIVANNFNPMVLSGQQQSIHESAAETTAKIMGDLAVGSIAGVASPTVKGAALAATLPMTIAYISDPEDPMNALATGVAFAGMHMAGSSMKKAQMEKVMTAFKDTADKAAYSSLSYYAPDILPTLKAGEVVPKYAFDFNTATNAKMKAVQNIWNRYFFDKNPDGTPAEVGMSLENALTEVKRVTASARQLWKGGLTPELQAKANVDDLLTYTGMLKTNKNALQNRFESMNQFGNPNIAKQAADIFDDSMMTRSLEMPKGTAPNVKLSGDIALTGAGLDINTPEAKYFFAQKAKGNASPTIILVDRPDTAPLWRMKNNMITPTQVKAGTSAPDPMPDNALQAFGIVKDPKTGNKELVPLGWVASNFRLNEGKYAFNNHPAVKKGAFPAIKINKDQLVPKMRQEGLDVLAVNLDNRATPETIQGQRPFIPVNINDRNWEYSKTLNDAIRQRFGNQNSLALNMARANTAVSPKGVADTMAAIREQVDVPGSKLLNQIPAKGSVKIAATATKDLLATAEGALDAGSPAELQLAFNNSMGIKLTDKQSQYLFENKGDLKIRDEVQIIVAAVNSKNASMETKMKTKFMKQYFESDTFRSSPVAKVLPEAKALPPITNEEGYVTNSVRRLPPVTTAEPLAPVADDRASKIVAAAQKELPLSQASPKAVRPVISAKDIQSQAASLAKPFIAEAQASIDDVLPKGSDRYQLQSYSYLYDTEINRATQAIQNDLSKRGVPQAVIDETIKQVNSSLSGSKAAGLRNLGATDRQLNAENQPLPDNIKQKEATGWDPDEIPPTGDIRKPGIYAEEFYNTLDESLKADQGTSRYYFAKTWDTVLRQLFGERYKNKVLPARFLSTIAPEGSRFWNYFNSTANAAGREISQPKAVLEARALGKRPAEMEALTARRELEKANPTSAGGTLSDSQLANAGVEPGSEGGFAGMNVKPWWQDENVVHDLTFGENMMAGVSSGLPATPATAVRDVKRIWFGTGKDSPGLLKFINNYLESMGKRKLSLPMSLFDKLEAQAATAEKGVLAKGGLESANTVTANQGQALYNEDALKTLRSLLPGLNKPEMIEGKTAAEQAGIGEAKAKLANLVEILEKNPQYKETEAAMNDIAAMMEKYYKPVDAQGGPGWFSNITDTIKNFFSPKTSAQISTKPEPVSDERFFAKANLPPVIPQEEKSYSYRGVKFKDNDIPEIANILYSEVSNRPTERQRFEIDNILNTAANRSLNPNNTIDYGTVPDRNKTLVEIMQRKGQYQGYGSDQYNKIKAGELDYPSQQKYNTILQYLNQIKNTGDIKDITGGAMYYVHASDGTLWLGSTGAEAMKRAREHEAAMQK